MSDDQLIRKSREDLRAIPMVEQMEWAEEYLKNTITNMANAGLTSGVIEEALMEIVVDEWVEIADPCRQRPTDRSRIRTWPRS